MMSPDGSITLTNGISGSTSTSSSTSVHASITLPSGSSTASKKPVDGGGGGITAGGGAPTSAGGSGTLPRVDLEPIYDALRAGLTLEQWIRYKEGLAGFVMGRISRLELSTITDPIITGSKQRLHNQLLLGLYSNSTRDSPPQEVAPWVLATNKAANALGGSAGARGGRGAGGDSGDAKVEARLKVEVMALAPRDRRRIKEVPEQDPEEILPSMLYDYYMEKQIKIPDQFPPANATPNALNNKTNWEVEIKARYSLPLACESGEFPDLDQIRMRILPICYEEGVIGGVGDNTAHFMNVATEVFVKEVLSTVISRVRCNRTSTVKTDSFKRKMEEMSDETGGAPGIGGFGMGMGSYTLNLNGSINTSTSTRPKKRSKLLPNGRRSFRGGKPQKHKPPQQRELAGERKVLRMNDLRLSFALGDNFLTQLPLSLNKIMSGGWEMPEEYYHSTSSGSFASSSAAAAAAYAMMPPPPLPRSRNQPNFTRKGAGASSSSGVGAGTTILNVLVASAGGVPPSSSQPSITPAITDLPSPPITQDLQPLPPPTFTQPPPPPPIPQDDFFDGFEAWADLPPPQSLGLGYMEYTWDWPMPYPYALPPGQGNGVPTWEGAGVDERRELKSVLDDCLAVGM